MARKKLLNDKTLVIAIAIIAVAIVFFSAVSSGALQGFSILTSRGAEYNPPSCTDSDHGKTYNINGYVEGYRDNIYHKYNDYCSDANTVVEYFCINDGETWSYTSSNCKSSNVSGSCVDGACTY